MVSKKAEPVEVERKALKYLRQVVLWRGSEDPEDEEFLSLPARLSEDLRHSTAHQLISTWKELRASRRSWLNGLEPQRHRPAQAGVP